MDDRGTGAYGIGEEKKKKNLIRFKVKFIVVELLPPAVLLLGPFVAAHAKRLKTCFV